MSKFNPSKPWNRYILKSNISRYKYIAVLLIVLAVVIITFVHQLYIPVYENFTVIKLSGKVPVENESFSAPGKEGTPLQGKINSQPLITETIEDLALEISFFKENPLLESSDFSLSPFKVHQRLYTESPLMIEYDRFMPQPAGIKFYVTFISNELVQVEANGEHVALYDYPGQKVSSYVENFHFNEIVGFGENFKNEYLSITIKTPENFHYQDYQNGRYFFMFHDPDVLYKEIQHKMSIRYLGTHTYKIALQGDNPLLIKDFLNQLVHNYTKHSLQEKNEEASNALAFIDKQMGEISGLQELQEKSTILNSELNKLAELNFEEKKVFEQLENLESEKISGQTQLKYYDYVKNYFASQEEYTGIIMPVAMEVNDPALNAQVTDLITYARDREKLLLIHDDPDNYYVRNMESKIQTLKNTILNSINFKNYIAENHIKELDRRLDKLKEESPSLFLNKGQGHKMSSRIRMTPEVYQYLITKRAEAQLAIASHTPDVSITEEARWVNATTVSPKKVQDYLWGILTALFISILYFLYREFLRNKIRSVEEVSSFTNIPLLGQIYRDKAQSFSVVLDQPQSPVSESFAQANQNLKYFISKGNSHTIVFTSPVHNELNTFYAYNFALTCALKGQKTLFIQADFTDSALSLMIPSGSNGLMSYLVNYASLKSIIQSTNEANLDVIAGGPVPPNLHDWLNSGSFLDLLQTLKKSYPFIIIHAAPLTTNDSAKILSKLADITVYTFRINLTKRNIFRKGLVQISEDKEVKLCLWAGDIKPKTKLPKQKKPENKSKKQKKGRNKRKEEQQHTVEFSALENS